MNSLSCKIKNYLSEDSAVDGEVSMIIRIVLAIAAVMGIGFFAWNLISSQANKATDLTTQENPGAGNEFSGNPFGN